MLNKFCINCRDGYLDAEKITVNRVAASAVAATLLFFIITNFGAWLMSAAGYPMTSAGLIQAYVEGIPFLQNSLLGNLAFTAVMFGGFSLFQRQFLPKNMLKV